SRWSPTSLSPAAIARINLRRSSNGKSLSFVPTSVKDASMHRSGVAEWLARPRCRVRQRQAASDLEDVLFLVRDHLIDGLHAFGHGLLGLLLRAVDVVR